MFCIENLHMSFIMTLAVPPDVVSMTLSIDGTSYNNNDVVNILPGDHTFVCGSTNARPAASLSWDFDGTAIPETSGTATSDGGKEDSSSTIDAKTLSGSDCGLVVKCTASNSATVSLSETPPSLSVTLKVMSK